MNTKLLINPKQQEMLDTLHQRLPQSLLLAGQEGIGLATIARKLAAQNHCQTLQPELLTKASTVKQIGIERIRDLYEQTRAKSRTPQVFIIDNADAMTIAAQNSFLKLLEEPTPNTHFILTSHTPSNLLPTLRSRVQDVWFSPLTLAQSNELVARFSLSPVKKRQITYIAQGLPAEITRLATDEAYFQTVSRETTLAKQCIEASSYQKLVVLQRHTLNRTESLGLIARIISLLERHPNAVSVVMLGRCIQAQAAIKAGGNSKLHLAWAMV